MNENDLERAKSWMNKALTYETNDYLDCGEVNCTKLAEDAAEALELYADEEATIPEEVFDLAAEVAEEFES